MLTKLTLRNFKRFQDVEIELGDPVVFIGPNNSGKTTALQALSLWQLGVSRWNEKRKGRTAPEKRPGVTISRGDLLALPIPSANLLWRDLRTREAKKTATGQKAGGTSNIRIDIIVEGIVCGRKWECGLEFDYANEESFYCRPLRLPETSSNRRMAVPDEAGQIQMAFLPPMSGLASNETRLDHGAINVRIGEGKTAEVLRNLCYSLYTSGQPLWKQLVDQINSLFGSELDAPQYIQERGELVMTYRENNTRLDLSSSGRGLQQTLLLLAYMYANPKAVLLLDEPDAHLEILRQRQIYQTLTEVAQDTESQVIAASHSEILLNEAASRDVVVAFVGKPHRIDDRKGSQVLKALRDVGFEDYYLAEQTGWVLYLEGSTDLAILRSFAKLLDYQEALKVLERPFVRYVGNQPGEVRKHFHGLREAVPNLVGVAVFDRLDKKPPSDLGAQPLIWNRREIENYLCYPETLTAYAGAGGKEEIAGPLFDIAGSEMRVAVMRKSISELEQAIDTTGKSSPWDADCKVSDDFLNPLFKNYFKELGLYNIMAKKNFHDLARFTPVDKIDPEIKEKLDAIVDVASAATPGECE